MANIQYIGARYVTKIYENSLDPSSAEWESNVNYEPLVMVTYNYGSYLSKKIVPASVGNPADNPSYWVQTGFYNGQISNLQNQIDAINANIGDLATLKTVDKSEIVKAINEIYAGFNYGEWISVKEFGAVGDGITDDTQAFKDAIAYMQTNRIGLYVPSGDYRITDTLALDDNNNRFWKIRGCHKVLSVIRFDLTGGSFGFDLTASGTFRYAEIYNLTLINNDSTIDVKAINIYRMSHSQIHDIIFRQFTTSIKASMSWCMSLHDCEFRNRSTASNDSQIILSFQCNVWNLYNLQINNVQGHIVYAIEISRAQSTISLKNCSIEYGLGIFLQGLSSDSAPLNCVNIDSCYFEWMEGLCIRSGAGAADLIKNVVINNCYFNALSSASVACALDLRWVDGVTVSECYCVRFITSMISHTGARPQNGNYTYANNVCDNVPVVIDNVHMEIGNTTAAPSTGYHNKGEIMWNISPDATNIGWICTAAGTPGTWTVINPS